MNKTYKSRRHCILLYPEDESHVKALEYIERYFKYCYISHNADSDEETGELKKAHWHVIVEFQNPKYNTAIAKELEITDNYIQECRNYEKALEYLIHFNEEKKHQYGIEEVKGELKSKLIKVIKNDGTDENDKVKELMEYINKHNRKISVTEFAREAADSGQWDVFRRGSAIFLKILDEHNSKYAYHVEQD